METITEVKERAKVNELLDYIQETHNASKDYMLAKVLGMLPPEVANLRRGYRKPGATLVLKAFFLTGLPPEEIMQMAGIDGNKFKVDKSD